MTNTELEAAIDNLIWKSGLALPDVWGVLESMLDRYTSKAAPPTPYKGPARDGREAQHGLNDVYPGDGYP